jgi:hypothetical protein
VHEIWIWLIKVPWFSIQILSRIWNSFYKQICSSFKDVHNHILFAIFWVRGDLLLVDPNSRQFDLVWISNSIQSRAIVKPRQALSRIAGTPHQSHRCTTPLAPGRLEPPLTSLALRASRHFFFFSPRTNALPTVIVAAPTSLSMAARSVTSLPALSYLAGSCTRPCAHHILWADQISGFPRRPILGKDLSPATFLQSS